MSNYLKNFNDAKNLISFDQSEIIRTTFDKLEELNIAFAATRGKQQAYEAYSMPIKDYLKKNPEAKYGTVMKARARLAEEFDKQFPGSLPNLVVQGHEPALQYVARLYLIYKQTGQVQDINPLLPSAAQTAERLLTKPTATASTEDVLSYVDELVFLKKYTVASFKNELSKLNQDKLAQLIWCLNDTSFNPELRVQVMNYLFSK